MPSKTLLKKVCAVILTAIIAQVFLLLITNISMIFNSVPPDILSSNYTRYRARFHNILYISFNPGVNNDNDNNNDEIN